jgi:hypothetical protein
MIRIIVVLIILIAVVVFSEQPYLVNIKSIAIGFGYGFSSLVFIMCFGLLIYKVYEFYKLKYWTITFKNLCTLILVLVICLSIMLGIRSLIF